MPLALALVVTSSTGAGFWLLLRGWRARVETQLRLDLCTAHAAIRLKASLERIDAANARVRTLREAIAAAALFPQAQAPLRTALAVQAGFLQAELMGWRIYSGAWIAGVARVPGLECLRLSDTRLPLPSLPWTSVPPDALGPRPLAWTGAPGPTPYAISIGLSHPPRHSHSEVYRHENLWQLRWLAPTKRGSPAFWTSIR